MMYNVCYTTLCTKYTCNCNWNLLDY